MWVVLRETYKGWWNIMRASDSRQFLPLLDLRRQVKEWLEYGPPDKNCRLS